MEVPARIPMTTTRDAARACARARAEVRRARARGRGVKRSSHPGGILLRATISCKPCLRSPSAATTAPRRTPCSSRCRAWNVRCRCASCDPAHARSAPIFPTWCRCRLIPHASTQPGWRRRCSRLPTCSRASRARAVPWIHRPETPPRSQHQQQHQRHQQQQYQRQHQQRA
jgi:hypothetical protein